MGTAICWPPGRGQRSSAARANALTSPSVEANAEAEVNQLRSADRGWIGLDEIGLVEDVLHAEERLDVPTEIARCSEIHDRISGQPGAEIGVVAGVGQSRRRNEVDVLIVVVLQADELEPQGHSRVSGIRVRQLSRSAVLGHLW